MQIRFYRPDDLSQLERFYQAQGFAYEMPNLADPLYFIKMVGEQDGKIVNACVAHLTAELYFLADKKAGNPAQRFSNFLTLHEAFSEVAYRQGGLSDFFCWVPPQVARPFGRRLLKLGWKRPLWPCFAKELGK
jgi:hypothetical protein